MNLISFGINTLSAGIAELFISVISLLPKINYILCNSFLTVLDIFQLLFRKLAGLDGYYVNGNYQEGDIVYQFIKGTVMGEYPVLTNVFWGLLVFGIILLFLSTIISIIRNEYTAEKDGNSKSKIIGKSFKSIFYFAIVPIVVLFGVYLSNVILVAVDKVTSSSTANSTILKTNLLEKYTKINDEEDQADSTSESYIAYNFFGIPVGTTTTTFSGVIFKAAAYNANRVRNTTQVIEENGTSYNGFFGLVQANVANNFNGLFRDDNGNADVVAEYIDQAFGDFVKLKITGSSSEYLLKYDSTYIQNYNVNDFNPFAGLQDLTVESLNRYNVELVWYYYDLFQFNFLVAIAAGIVMMVIFVNIIIGLMKRIVELFGLFLISAPLVALMPLDDGKSYNKWRENFIKKTLMAYGAVGGMNIFFLIFPYLNEIQFFNILVVDRIISTIIMIVGLVSVKSFIGLISEFVSGENAEATGGAIAKDVGNAVAKAGLMTAAGFATGGAGFLAAGKIGAKGIGTAVSKINKQRTAKARFGKDKGDWDKKRDEKYDPKYAEEDERYAAEQKEIDSRREEYEREADSSISNAAVLNKAQFNAGPGGKIDPLNYANEMRRAREQLKQEAAAHRISSEKLISKSKHDLNVSGIDATKAADTIDMPNLDDYKVHPISNFGSGAKNAIGYSVKTALPPIGKSLANLFKVGYDEFKENPFTKAFSDAGGFTKMATTITDPSGKKYEEIEINREVKPAYKKMRAEGKAKAKIDKENAAAAAKGK